MNNTEQKFLKFLDDKLWKAADKLRANLDAANYKHVVLGLIFLKYVSDAFEERQEELLELFKTDSDDNIYYLPRDDGKPFAEKMARLTSQLKDRFAEGDRLEAEIKQNLGAPAMALNDRIKRDNRHEPLRHFQQRRGVPAEFRS